LSKSFSQNETLFSSELFKISLSDNLLLVKSNDGEEIYTKEFLNSGAYSLDLDGDGVDEFLIKDIIESDSSQEYLLYVYNLLDTFFLAGEINSGVIEPYETFSEEIEGLIIVSGNPDFSYLNKESEIKMLPANCWKFEDGELFLVNEELYEIFITENDNHLSVIYAEDIKDCGKSKQVKSLLASVYINSLNAGEIASAENFLKTFYLCEDLENFKEELNNLFYMEN
jgi:hypothetical protein